MISRHSSTFAAALERSVASPNWRIRAAVAQNPRLTPDQVDRLSLDKESHVRSRVAQRTDLSPQQLERLYNDPSYWVLANIAEHQKLSSNALERLLRHGDDHRVRRGIARRADLSPYVIIELGKDPSWLVREALAQHLNVPAGKRCSVIDQLSGDENAAVRIAVCRRPDLSEELIDAMSLDADVHVRRAVAERFDLPPAITQRLRVDADPYVQKTIANLDGLRASLLQGPGIDPVEANSDTLDILEPGEFEWRWRLADVPINAIHSTGVHTPDPLRLASLREQPEADRRAIILEVDDDLRLHLLDGSHRLDIAKRRGVDETPGQFPVTIKALVGASPARLQLLAQYHGASAPDEEASAMPAPGMG